MNVYRSIRSIASPARLLRWVWLALAALALILFAAGAPTRYAGLLDSSGVNQRVLQDLGLSLRLYAHYFTILDGVLVLAHILIAALIVWRSAGNRVALLVAITLVTAPLAATGALDIEAVGLDSPLWQAVADLLIFVGLVSSISLLFLFPNGRFVPRSSIWLVLIWIGLTLAAISSPKSPISMASLPSGLLFAVLLAWGAAGVGAQLVRFRRVSGPLQRQQTRWAVLGLAAAALSPFGYYFGLLTLPTLSRISPPTLFYNLADPTLFLLAALLQLGGLTIYTLALLLFPLSFAVAILRHRLFDIEIAVNRTLVYGTLTALILVMYIITVTALGSLFQAQGSRVIAVAATALVALLFEPIRARLQRGVNRLMYGERDDPLTVLNRTAQQLAGTLPLEAVLPTIVATVAQALRLPYVAIVLTRDDGQPQGRPVADYGQPGSSTVDFPLIYQGRIIGHLTVAPRGPGERFSPTERRLLENVAQQASAAVRTVQLTDALQQARERLVTAREEERRRLRRDLHDHLGARLAAMTLEADTIRQTVSRAPTEALPRVAALHRDARLAADELRALAHRLQEQPGGERG